MNWEFYIILNILYIYKWYNQETKDTHIEKRTKGYYKQKVIIVTEARLRPLYSWLFIVWEIFLKSELFFIFLMAWSIILILQHQNMQAHLHVILRLEAYYPASLHSVKCSSQVHIFQHQNSCLHVFACEFKMILRFNL